ncbi:MAG: ornithine carbamoyltransferase [Candidatus Margulisiibacteriota bacterium]|nr:ornithine carbamoyltransferase [Candidatus Margulisiibacteriota bacterium]
MFAGMKDLVSIHDLSSQEIQKIFNLASKLKGKPESSLLKGKSLALIFEKPSTRTRVSFEVGMYQLGGKTVHLSPRAVQLGEREAISDVARTLSRYVNGVMLRTFSHKNLVEYAKYSDVPVINGLSDLLHPCQALADIFTVLEKKKSLKEIKFAYIGDGNNVCNSLMFAAAKTGMDLTVATPRGFEPRERVTELVFQDAKKTGCEIDILNDPVIAARDADVIYTDVWASMGQEKESKNRKKKFNKFQVNAQLLALAKKDTIIMHCLPAHRGEEITDKVLESKSSVVFDQAENRLHVQKAVLAILLGGKND